MNPSFKDMYSQLPETYESLNHILTFGQDILWRRKAAGAVARSGGGLWLDACGGTGEMAVSLSHLAKGNTKIVVADLSLPMMEKALEKPQCKPLAFVAADAGYLPFKDNSFHGAVIAFAIRNLSFTKDHLLKCLREFQRVLKPGGRFITLETSQPKAFLVRKLFHFYAKLTVAPLGRLISGSTTAYTYLRDSMCKFYTAEELCGIMKQAGFSQVTFQRLFLGAASIHQAVK